MTKMEIELTDEQLEKVKLLESRGISVGEAIDMLFEARDKASEIITSIDKTKLEEDEEPETDASEETPATTGKTYDVAIQDMKHHVSWAEDFFKL